jgi:hypothetical protein
MTKIHCADVACWSFQLGNGGSDGSSELPTQLALPLPPPPLLSPEGPSLQLPALLDGSVDGGREMFSTAESLTISHSPVFRL